MCLGRKEEVLCSSLSHLDNNNHERYKTAHASLNPLRFGIPAHFSFSSLHKNSLNGQSAIWLEYLPPIDLLWLSTTEHVSA